MTSKSSRFRLKMKMERPELYQKCLEANKERNRKIREKEKKLWDEGTPTKIMIKSRAMCRQRAKEDYFRKKRKAMAAEKGIAMESISQTELQARTSLKELSAKERRAYNAAMRRQQRAKRSSEKIEAENMKRRQVRHTAKQKREEVFVNKVKEQTGVLTRLPKKAYSLNHEFTSRSKELNLTDEEYAHTVLNLLNPRNLKKRIAIAAALQKDHPTRALFNAVLSNDMSQLGTDSDGDTELDTSLVIDTEDDAPEDEHEIIQANNMQIQQEMPELRAAIQQTKDDHKTDNVRLKKDVTNLRVEVAQANFKMRKLDGEIDMLKSKLNSLVDNKKDTGVAPHSFNINVVQADVVGIDSTKEVVKEKKLNLEDLLRAASLQSASSSTPLSSAPAAPPSTAAPPSSTRGAASTLMNNFLRLTFQSSSSATRARSSRVSSRASSAASPSSTTPSSSQVPLLIATSLSQALSSAAPPSSTASSATSPAAATSSWATPLSSRASSLSAAPPSSSPAALSSTAPRSSCAPSSTSPSQASSAALSSAAPLSATPSSSRVSSSRVSSSRASSSRASSSRSSSSRASSSAAPSAIPPTSAATPSSS